jgi:hypothetical protein
VVAISLVVVFARMRDWRSLAIAATATLSLGPVGKWVWDVAEKSRPLDGRFTYRIAEQMLSWSPGLRRVLAFIWCVQCLACVTSGIQLHRALLAAQLDQRNALLATVFIVPLQIAMTLGANLYLLLATAGWGGRPERLEWMHRHRYWMDLALTIATVSWLR